MKYNIFLEEKEIISVTMPQNDKNDDLEYIFKKIETNITIFTNISKKM
jgi:hypothetical protein